jgi:hypothetical protein
VGVPLDDESGVGPAGENEVDEPKPRHRAGEFHSLRRVKNEAVRSHGARERIQTGGVKHVVKIVFLHRLPGFPTCGELEVLHRNALRDDRKNVWKAVQLRSLCVELLSTPVDPVLVVPEVDPDFGFCRNPFPKRLEPLDRVVVLFNH